MVMLARPPGRALMTGGNLTPDALKLIGYFAGRYARRRYLDRDDLFQGAALRLVRNAAKYDPTRGDLTTWVLFAVRYATGRMVAARIRHRHSDYPDDVCAGRECPAEATERAEALAAVRGAVDDLPEKRRAEVVRRFGLDGEPAVSFGEIDRSRHASVNRCRVLVTLRHLGEVLADFRN